MFIVVSSLSLNFNIEEMKKENNKVIILHFLLSLKLIAY